MIEFLRHLFSQDFLPHGHCFLGRKDVVWLHVISDAVIALAYYSIPATLLYLVRKHADLAFKWVFVLFAAFILGCGTTHVMGIWEIWHPTYRLGGLVKALTALTSIGTAAVLWPLVPRVLRVPGTTRLLRQNEALKLEVGEHARSSEAAKLAAEELERRVRERTAQLQAAVRDLESQIAERRRAEQALRESEALKGAIVASALDAVITMDQEGRVVEFNPAAEAMFGRKSDEVAGQELADLVVPERLRAAHVSGLARFRETGEGPVLGHRLELAALRRDGAEFPVELSIARVGQGEPALFTGFVRDITDRKRSESELSRLNAELEARVAERTHALELANTELESFSYSVSHDLRSPLRSIDGFSKALLEDHFHVLDTEGKEYLHRIRAASQRMGTLIDDMLQLARVTRGELRNDEIDLSDMAGSIMGELRDAHPTRRVETDVVEGARAWGDPALVRQALQNLLENAWKFTGGREVAHVEFGRATVGGEDAFFVRDDGAGFDMAYSGKLFGVFQRLHSNAEFPGTGVGLATVQRIVRRHGGRAWAESSPGKGATFYFTLPRRRADA